MNLHEFARQMPKVELHVHLEGAIRPATLLRLARHNGVALPAQDEDGLREFYRFRDFPHFVEVYVTITSCLHSAGDYALVAYEFGADCARQNIRYAEVTFTIATNLRLTGLPWQEIMEGLNAGRERAHQEFGVGWNWVLDISRDNPSTQDQVLEIALAARDQGVVALGLGGSEAEFPPELFTRTFERALKEGLPRVPHAGETSGPESIWSALRDLHANRIGHGVHCIADSDLVEHLRRHQIPLEVCPTSNVRLGIYPDYASHPLRELWDLGLMISVGSDDPPLFGTDLNHEYELLIERFDFSAGELEQLSLNGVRASFLADAEKLEMEKAFREEFAQLREGR